MEHLQAWLKAERGRLARLADGLRIEHTSIYSWKKVPAERVANVESLTGISRHDLRPDIFGPAPHREAAE